MRRLVFAATVLGGLLSAPALAQMLQAIVADQHAGGGGGGALAFNPADKDSSITLSNSDKTASTSTIGSYVNARSVTHFTTGQKYFKFTIDSLPVGGSGDNLGMGIANSTAAITGYCGPDTNSACYYANAGKWGENNSFPTDFPAAAQGDYVCIAVDFTGYSGGTTTVQVSVNGAAYSSHTEGIPNPAGDLYVFFTGVPVGGTAAQVTVDPAGTGCPSPGGGYSLW